MEMYKKAMQIHKSDILSSISSKDRSEIVRQASKNRSIRIIQERLDLIKKERQQNIIKNIEELQKVMLKNEKYDLSLEKRNNPKFTARKLWKLYEGPTRKTCSIIDVVKHFAPLKEEYYKIFDTRYMMLRGYRGNLACESSKLLFIKHNNLFDNLHNMIKDILSEYTKYIPLWNREAVKEQKIEIQMNKYKLMQDIENNFIIK